jgi:hypothetical protein
MATYQEQYALEAKKKKGDKSLEELGTEAAEGRAGRRAMYAAGGQKLIEESEAAAEALEGVAQVGTAKALAAQGPGADLRALSGAATEAERAGAGAVAQARQQAAAGMMDVATGLEEMGTEVEDVSAKRQELTAAMNTIIDKHKGFWNDDEDAMYREIMDMVADPTTPEELKREFERKAEDIRSGDWDV